MAILNELKFELIPHPPCSPDLVPGVFFLFANLKKWLARKTFSTNVAVEEAVVGYFFGLKKKPIFRMESVLKNVVLNVSSRREFTLKIKIDFV